MLTPAGDRPNQIPTQIATAPWKRASIKSFSLFHQPLSARSEAWKTITELLSARRVEPVVAKTFPLEDGANAIRYLIEGRPFGRVIVTI
jgi:NADPH:quinone reductase